MQKRIGPKMQRVVSHVHEHPGCTKMEAGMHAWGNPRGRTKLYYIYAPVDRAIKAGLIRAERMPNGHYRLTPLEN